MTRKYKITKLSEIAGFAESLEHIYLEVYKKLCDIELGTILLQLVLPAASQAWSMSPASILQVLLVCHQRAARDLISDTGKG